PDAPLEGTIENLVEQLGEEGAVAAVRGVLKPHLQECCDDADILEAARNTAGPLYARGLCQIQVMRRHTELDAESQFVFSPEVLRRERVRLDLSPLPAMSPVAAAATQVAADVTG